MADAPLSPDLSKVDPADAWKPWRPAAGAWTPKWVAHLYRRAAFGPTPQETEKALAIGLPKTLDGLLAGEPDAADRLDLLTESGKYYTDTTSLRTWWLYAMIEGGHPLREKLTLFWHNHFATSYAKVRSTKLMYEQNVTLRKHALGRFPAFLLDMSKDTAMLVWLDSNRNVKGAPNENYAREVMELFSLGVGNYTEKDIQEAARALTGWHHDTEVTRFEFNRDLHDPGEKTIFGKTGKWTGEDVVRLCCERDACARFLVAKLYTFLVSETPPPKGLLAPLETEFRASGYDIAALVKAVLGSNLFFSEHAYRKRVKWPVECALGAINAAVPGRVPLQDVTDPLAKMGQALFAPPNVKGWRTGTDWLNSATLLARNNFAERVALGTWGKGGRPPRNATFAFVAEPAKVESPSANAPPPPDSKFDVCEFVYAAKPKDVAAVVKQLGALLYGDTVPAPVAKKLETFLLTPVAAPASGKEAPAAPPGAPGGAPAKPPEPAPPPKKGGAKKAEAKKDEPKQEPPKPLDPKDVKLESPEFKARVREAVHAMMCLPEYQLD
ncbi:DUF1800 domain-containing protein [Frigoriglobus tundricola]|uniref:DUF1800 domain-containing protein n=1 Tax=Frigoriglobus tundricola TaxID=2774151 RepID=A0A6M5YKH4_9BACT|nr:DUF1800 domain-containing protein [Frigoriglobus tundricola]QJW94579.1 hypothetical protein FTUN_2100 [Frigoriglobus tundricola]